MNHGLRIFGFLVLFGALAVSSEDFVGQKSIGKRQEYLDSNGQFLVEWEAYTDTQTIIFELTVATTGYVGFGISPVGGMTGADIVIGGIHPNGSVYFSVRYSLTCQTFSFKSVNFELFDFLFLIRIGMVLETERLYWMTTKRGSY